MYRKTLVMLCSAASLAVALTVSPAEAQGKGKGKGHKKSSTRVETRADRYDDRDSDYERYGDYDDRYRTTRSSGNGSGKVPPGWCKGKGNPHNTRENCGYRSDGRYDDRYGRNTDRRSGRSGSFERDHADFHYYLDRKYADLSRGRALDLPAQIELRMRKKAEHDEFHRRTGTRH